MSQSALSVIARIQPFERKTLEDLLDVIGNDIDGKSDNHFVCFPDLITVHFACWVILRSAPDTADPARSYPDTLVLETNFDGALEDHLDELIARGGAALDAVYRCCEGWPTEGTANPILVKQYLKTHSVPTPAFYIGCPGQTLDSIRNAMAVRAELETFLDSEEQKQPLAGLTPGQVRQKLLDYLRQGTQTQPEISPETQEAQLRRSGRNVMLTGLVLLVASPFLLLISPLILITYLVLRRHESVDAAKPLPTPLPIDPRLFGKEDYCVQNHLTTLVEVKPGAFRLYTLKAILGVINIVAKTLFITGQLGGIPTIHFARWILMDNDRRLLFFSNYDGSWASYLGDFVDKANYGLTAVWSNTERFPPAVNLAWGGAQHIEAFKQWSREHNVYAAVWYSAYPNETLRNLKNDIQIRDRIALPNLSEADTTALLQLL